MVDDAATSATDELRLTPAASHVEASGHAVHRARLVVLNERRLQAASRTPVEVERAGEPAAVVGDGGGAEGEHTSDRDGGVVVGHESQSFQGASPASQRELSSTLSRMVSMHCQK